MASIEDPIKKIFIWVYMEAIRARSIPIVDRPKRILLLTDCRQEGC